MIVTPHDRMRSLNVKTQESSAAQCIFFSLCRYIKPGNLVDEGGNPLLQCGGEVVRRIDPPSNSLCPSNVNVVEKTRRDVWWRMPNLTNASNDACCQDCNFSKQDGTKAVASLSQGADLQRATLPELQPLSAVMLDMFATWSRQQYRHP